ncbi:MAG: hypothetical protein QNJ97_23265 [Myxococcota bacterium]|nr:hypothetical protein [Myxococcota bacterium]
MIKAFGMAAVVAVFHLPSVGFENPYDTPEPQELPRPETATAPGNALDPIPESWTEAFAAIRPDPHPEKLTRDSHYWISDERRHDLFRNAIENQGGIFIGLGTDQNYLMAGWSRPEILIPLDFDQMIVSLHFAYRVIFLNAQTPQDFIALWEKGNTKKVKGLIAAAYPDPVVQKSVFHAFKRSRRLVHARLRRVVRSYGRRGISTYLDDMAQYRFVTDLFKTGRVFPVRGDLTGKTTVRDVAAAALKVGLPIRTLYLSNAEQYFKYSKDFRQNMLALPMDDASVVIRTVGKKTEWAADGLYEYVIQSGKNFSAWLKYPKAYAVWTLVQKRRVDKRTGRSEITALPPNAAKTP